jgi:TPP-dependent 2-oxoacid decarboxylase
MRSKYVLLLLLIFIIIRPIFTIAQVSEYRLKAIFLERFTHFIEWPDSAKLYDKKTPFIIGVYGDENFKTILESIYATQKIKSHKVIIKSIKDTSEIPKCHLIYIGKNVKKNIKGIVNSAQKMGVLTIGEKINSSNNGIIIRFYTVNRKIHFKVDKNSAENSGFKLDYHLFGNGR